MLKSKVEIRGVHSFDEIFVNSVHPFFQRSGIFSPWQRLLLNLLGKNAAEIDVVYKNEKYLNLFQNKLASFASNNLSYTPILNVNQLSEFSEVGDFSLLFNAEAHPARIVSSLYSNLISDYKLLGRVLSVLQNHHSSLDELELPFDLSVLKKKYGDNQKVNITTQQIANGIISKKVQGGSFSCMDIEDQSIEVSPFAIMDESKGPIFLSPGVKISGHSWLRGPLFIGSYSELDNVNIRESSVGRVCRLGGEIESSLINDFSNKHHDGFLGHSILGSWVNLGAMTTTSDLKNNYGEIRLHYLGEMLETGLIKFGSLIGDYVKTSIGTMLNTGTCFGTGAMVFGSMQGLKFLPPFKWGCVGNDFYELDRFLSDTKKIMARRKQTMISEKENNLKDFYLRAVK